MELATAHVLTALYALCHRFALTPDEVELLDERGAALTPAVWRETRDTLKLADQASGPVSVELGFMPFIFHWLGVSDEQAFVGRYGAGIGEALARDRGLVAVLAHALEGGPGRRHEFYQLPLTHAWSARASRLLEGLPETGGVVLLTLERTIDDCPWEPEWLRPLLESTIQVSDLVGEEERGASARRMLERIERETGVNTREPFVLTAATQLLTALWLLTHDGHLLDAERGLEPGIESTPEAWSRLAEAARARRVEDIPVPVRLVRGWGAPDELTDEAAWSCLRDSASRLPQVVDEIERVWGGQQRTGVTQEVARAVASIAVIRHMQVQHGFRPVPGEKASIWFEVHQGIRRPETMERAALLRGLRAVLLRCEIDPLAVAAAQIDCAGENQATGAHDQTRADLAQAMHWTSKYEGEQARRDHGAVCVAQFLWLAGEPEEAMLRLARLEGEGAAQLLHAMDTRKEERAALLVAEAGYRKKCDLVSWCALGKAHLAAGHNVRAELVAREICEQQPETGLAQGFLASILFELERYRDAVAPARRALELGLADSAGRALLARSLARIGPEGREEATTVAIEVLEAEDIPSPVPPDVSAALANVAWYGGADIRSARRADDLIWEHCPQDEFPPEWVGSAVARRCHRVWAEDAPLWLARLSGVARDSPAEFARFVVERVDALLWWRSLIERQLFADADKVRDDGACLWTDEAAKKLVRPEVRKEAVGFALQAAISLEYAEAAVEEGNDRSEVEFDSGQSWEPHLSLIASCVGDELVIRLRASELAQEICFGSEEVAERQLLVVLETFEFERVAWLRWAGEDKGIGDFAGNSSFEPGTRALLDAILEFSRADDDDGLRADVWATRWHEAVSR